MYVLGQLKYNSRFVGPGGWDVGDSEQKIWLLDENWDGFNV